jgi:hypothetical protein
MGAGLRQTGIADSLQQHRFGSSARSQRRCECGVVHSNAAGALKRAPVRGKQIALPTTEKFNSLISEMRAGTAAAR